MILVNIAVQPCSRLIKRSFRSFEFENLEGENLEKGLKIKRRFFFALFYHHSFRSGDCAFNEGLKIAPAKALEVYDVTGAGDSVIAVLAFVWQMKLKF